MLNQREEIVIDNYNVTLKTLSIAKFLVILDDGQEVVRKEIDRCAFLPGDIDKVQAYIGKNNDNEINYLKSIWTDDVVKVYQDALNQP